MDIDIEALKKDPKKYVDSISIDKLFEFLEYANELYRNTLETVISDELYDWLSDYAKKKQPNHPFFKKIGAPVKEKVELPEWMGSLDKIRDDPKALVSWKTKYDGPYVLSDKLDGISGMFYVSKGQIQLFTRGDGYYGQNISAILNSISDSYDRFDKNMMVRGEFIISKENWEKIKHRGSNARNTVAGILNAKNPDVEIIHYLDFIAYELMEPKKKYTEGLDYLKALGFKTVPYKLIDKTSLTNDQISDYLIKRRSESLYEIDGIVVRDNEKHNYVKGKNPKYGFAYKTILTHEQAEVTVYKIEWNVSKDGYIKPTVFFNPVYINNVKIQKATGFNAAFIEQHKIGPGSKVIIIRSGDVIPHILKVLKPSETGTPSFPEDIKYTWNESHVDIQIQNDSQQMTLKQMEHFVNTLDIKHVGPGILQKFINHKIDSIEKLFTVEKQDILLMEGIKEKMADKIYTSLKQALQTTTCAKLMVASNIFGRGFGEKKIDLIIQQNPDILNKKLITKLNPTEGVAELTEKKFLKHLPEFYQFLEKINFKCKKETTPKKESNLFENMNIIFTGFRNKEWEDKITANGGKIVSSISKKTSLVVAADINDNSAKLVKAKELGIKILSKEDFIKSYNFS
jgi:DNA ligase (NAD+)